jgi:hypothetical protein
VRKLFKGGNYSREETINNLEVLTAETIQRRKLFKGVNYMRKYVKFYFLPLHECSFFSFHCPLKQSVGLLWMNVGSQLPHFVPVAVTEK